MKSEEKPESEEQKVGVVLVKRQTDHRPKSNLEFLPGILNGPAPSYKQAGTSRRSGDREAAGVVWRAEVEEPPRPELQPRKKTAEVQDTSASAAEPGAAAPADADKEGVYTAVLKKENLKKNISCCCQPGGGKGGVCVGAPYGPLWSLPSAVVEPSLKDKRKAGLNPRISCLRTRCWKGAVLGGIASGLR
ncbi:UNVERIFIED_CONTAM: hypothetical protein FKN15_040090 [Acipenser sinensis]